jgi:hypothetical protein
LPNRLSSRKAARIPALGVAAKASGLLGAHHGKNKQDERL